MCQILICAACRYAGSTGASPAGFIGLDRQASWTAGTSPARECEVPTGWDLWVVKPHVAQAAIGWHPGVEDCSAREPIAVE